MKFLSLEQVLKLHDDLIETFGGAPEIHDLGLLESALAAPFQTFGGEDLYPSLQAKASHQTTLSRMETSAPEPT